MLKIAGTQYLRFRLICAFLLFSLLPSVSHAQRDNSLHIFGYFQNNLTYQSEFGDDPELSAFILQQLNLFFQKDIADNWRAFVNFEFFNNFSSSRQWGAANLEEAWIRYRANEKFNLKLGLQIPVFNNLNTYKNRTPVLPYVIRPLAYETSFSEFIAVEEYTPGRGFVQTYGFLPIGKLKLDYALYVGNSPNINNSPERGQTGVDTTDTFLLGGRFGIRVGELKAGVSLTHDKVNGFPELPSYPGVPPIQFTGAPRLRIGGDLSYHLGPLSLESEFILVNYDEGAPAIEIDKGFFYATLGFYATDRFFAYISFWYTRENFARAVAVDDSTLVSGVSRLEIPTVGFSYNPHDRLRFKAQFAPVNASTKFNQTLGIAFMPPLDNESHEFNHYSIAVSVFF